jgi:filamentous hemagglutinin family protein
MRPSRWRKPVTAGVCPRRGRFLLVPLLLAGPGAVEAGPAGASYDRSQVQVRRNGSDTIVDQSANRAVIDWQSFDVARGEAVRFNQPGAAASTLNRVHAGRESVIAGGITAPGQVIIQNSNGVVFTETARVDVGSLIATSIGISNRNFADGRLIFDQPGRPDAVVRNSGTITVADQGLAAFVAPGVANAGTIVARGGTVALAAGNAATVDLHGDGLVAVAITDPTSQQPRGLDALIQQGGVIKAEGGRVVMTAQAAAGVIDSAINLSGLVQARTITADAGRVRLAGTLDASGATAGGSVRLQADRSTAIDRGASIDASATHDGPGGTIAIRSNGTAAVDGQLQARGAGRGKGGTVGTSARDRLNIGEHASVSVQGPGGNGGWLIDPASITVVSGGGSAGSIDAANAAAGSSTIGAGTIIDALAGGSVTLLATDLIDVQAAIVSGAASGLQLIADGVAGRVRVGAPIRLADGSLAIRARQAIDLTDAAQIDVGAGTVWLETAIAGRIAQAPGSGILAGRLAALSATVDLGSWNNNVGVLAGHSFNGGFTFNQTNASGTTTLGAVNDPFSTASVAGVSAEMSVPVGSQVFSSASADGVVTITLGAGGAAFDRLVFTALPYGLLENTPSPLPVTDSSDYFVRQVDFTLLGTGARWVLRPNTAATPSGFTMTTPLGAVVTDTNRWGVAAFTFRGPDNLNELQFDPIDRTTESMVMTLGGSTRAVTTTFAQFFRPEPSIPAIERGMVQFFATSALTPSIGARQTPGRGAPPAPPGSDGGTPPGTGLPGPTTSTAALLPEVQRMVEPMFRGRDPDTPSDAIWRTTAMENPFVENPFTRPYSLGTVQVDLAGLSPEQLGQLATAAGPATEQTGASEFSGQHTPRAVAPALDVNPINLGPEAAQQSVAAALAEIAPAAGGSGQPAPRPAISCAAGGFLANFWACR